VALLPASLRSLSPDGHRLFGTRMVRLFAYGSLSVVLVLYLIEAGLSAESVGLLLTLTLLGDTAVSLWLTTRADRFGRRRVLLVGAGLMVLAGVAFALTHRFVPLLVAATIGVISPSGNEVGPFLPVEQAALSEIVSAAERTRVFAWYNLVGSVATAVGALTAGALAQALQRGGIGALASYRWVVVGYAAMGLILAALFARLSPSVETRNPSSGTSVRTRLGLHRSRAVVFRLAALFSLDAFGGGLVVQSIVAYWFHVRFGAPPALLGGIFFAANLLAAASALAAARIASRIGLLNTMVFTHIPSNVFLLLVPLMPTLPLAITMLLLRFSISQMDVPTRQSYTMALVNPDERSAAAGVTGVARTTGAGLAPMFTGPLLANPALLGVPFLLAGGFKLVYDLALYLGFRRVELVEESTAPPHKS
jgi:MFS family permease